MTLQPKVSIVLANWNGAQFLDEAIQSVARQTVRDWELIAVDTGSDDSSCAILENWAAADSRVKLMLLPDRLSYPAAINLGLAKVRGTFIARIESDDLWLPHRLKCQLDFLEESGRQRVGVCGSDANVIDESGLMVGHKRFPRTHDECLRAIWYRNPFCHSAVLIRRLVLEKCGTYDETLACVEDLDLWFRVARQWELANLPQRLVCYRVWRGSITTKKLRTLAWRAHEVRNRAVSQLGYARPMLAGAYSVLTLGAALFPPMLVRCCFQRAIRLFGMGEKEEGRHPQGDAREDVHATAHSRECL